MNNIEIRKATIDDIEQLQKIAKQTFAETFAINNSQENMKEYLDKGFSIEQLKTELSSQNSAFYFAIVNNNVVGYLKINFGTAQTEIKDKHSLEIERIYVLKEFQGKKIGQFLLDKAIAISKQKKVNYVWLGVWEENPAAMHFYKKNGFVEFDKHIFKLGNEEQTDLMMKLRL